MPELLRALEAGSVLFRRGVQGRLVYARYFVLDLVAFVISSGLSLLLWLYVDANKPGGLPIPREQLIAYMALALAVNQSLSIWLDGILGSRIRTGQVATDLLKPINFQWLYFSSAMADVAIQSCMGLMVLGLAAWLLPYPPLALDAARVLVFLLSLGLALLVQYGVCFLIALGAFVTHNGYGLFFLRLMSHMAFSGIFAPLLLYPDGLRKVAQVLPFHCIIHTPVAIGLGLLPLRQAPQLLGEQALWALALIVAGQLTFGAVTRRLSIQGG